MTNDLMNTRGEIRYSALLITVPSQSYHKKPRKTVRPDRKAISKTSKQRVTNLLKSDEQTSIYRSELFCNPAKTADEGT